MARIEDKVGEWSGEFKFVLDDGTEFKIHPTLGQKRKLFFIERKLVDGTYTEKELEEQESIIEEIIRTAYPDFKEEQVNWILNEYSTEILMELYIAFKWRDKKVLDAFKVKQKKEIDKFLNDEPTTETPKV